MAQNTGTLISAAIRPNDSLDPIASAFASEIKGGLHTVSSVSDRNNIIFERREWGMMCYVTSIDKTYQLKFGFVSSSIMDNNNWVEFTGAGGSGGGGTEWIDSVISVLNSPPVSPSDGDRYLLGSFPSGGWSSLTASLVLTYNSTLSNWTQTLPTNGMSVIVDNEDNSIYKYVGTFPGGNWVKEKVNQLRSISFTTLDGIDYIGTSNPAFSIYDSEIMFLAQFDTANIGITVSVNINGLGQVDVRKPSQSGLVNLVANDIRPGVIYNLTYDGSDFQINRPYTNEDVFSVKHYVEASDYIVVPQYYQYWVYSDLEIVGHLVNYGQVVIANGALVLSGGTFSNFGSLAFANFDGTSSEATFYSSNTIQFTQSNTIFGPSVSATIIDGSITQSKISIQNSGNNGYLLGYTSSGDFFWFDGSTIVPSGTIAAITAGAGLTGGGTSSYLNIEVSHTIAGSGLSFSTGVINVNLNPDSLEVSGDSIRLLDTILGNRTFQDSLTVQGNLTVNGTVSNVYTEHLYVEDNIITLNATFSGSPFLDSGLEVMRGVSPSATLIWNETLDLWTAGLSGSSNPILTTSGNGLTQSGNTISLNLNPVYNRRNLQPLATTFGLDGQSTGISILTTPSIFSTVNVYVNGILQYLGDGTSSNVDCYFSNDGGMTAKNISSISSSDILYWNGNVNPTLGAGFSLTTADTVDIIYHS